MPEREGSSGTRIARNTLFNFAGQVLPGLAGLVCVPYLIHHLGVARFGVLSLAWVLLTYLSLFDLGFGRATVRFISEALGRDEHESVPRILWTSVTTQLVLGAAGGVLLVISTPLLVARVIRVPAALTGETIASLRLLAVALPILLVISSLRGVLESHQRFGLVNIVRVSANTLVFVAPAVVVAVSGQSNLVGILAILDVCLLLSALAYLALDLMIEPTVRRFTFERSRARALFAFGGWVTVCGLLVPVLVSSDRLFISAMVGVSLLAYYTVPYEVAFRLQAVPTSFVSVLFPAFSRLSGGNRDELGRLFVHSVRYLAIAVSVASLPVALFAHQLLQIWVGHAFATSGALLLQILVLGMVINAVTQVPAQLCDAAGRPDLRAKIFLSYLPIYLAVNYVLIGRFGLLGAAVAWTARASLELGLFFSLSVWILRIPAARLSDPLLIRTLAVLGIFLGLGAASITAAPVLGPTYIAIAAGLSLALPIALWLISVPPIERAQLRRVVQGPWSGRLQPAGRTVVP